MSPHPQAVEAPEAVERPLAERRAHVRTPSNASAELTLIGRTVEGELRDVGAGGVCFTTTDPHLVVAGGNFVRIAFDCERAGRPDRLERSVRVLRVDSQADGDATTQVIGLQFEELLKVDGISFPAP